MKRIILYPCWIIVILTASSFTTLPSNEWQHLGSRIVNYGLDKDVIRLGVDEGRFSRLKLQVSGGGLNMHAIVVEYGNGSNDTIEIRHHFSRCSGSRVLDLKGGGRVIRKVTFWYDTKNIARKRAKVHLFGKSA